MEWEIWVRLDLDFQRTHRIEEEATFEDNLLLLDVMIP